MSYRTINKTSFSHSASPCTNYVLGKPHFFIYKYLVHSGTFFLSLCTFLLRFRTYSALLPAMDVSAPTATATVAVAAAAAALRIHPADIFLFVRYDQHLISLCICCSPAPVELLAILLTRRSRNAGTTVLLYLQMSSVLHSSPNSCAWAFMDAT